MHCSVPRFLFELTFYPGDHGTGGITNHFSNEKTKALKDA